MQSYDASQAVWPLTKSGWVRIWGLVNTDQWNTQTLNLTQTVEKQETLKSQRPSILQGVGCTGASDCLEKSCGSSFDLPGLLLGWGLHRS